MITADRVGQDLARRDPAYYTPDDPPAEVAEFVDPIRDNLAVGSAGKVGLLDLKLAPSGGVTRIVDLYHRAPLYLYRPPYLDPSRPDMAFIYLQQGGDGLVQGDRYRLDIDCAAGSAAHITTQTPTKVFAARTNGVTQMVNISVGADAFVEYLPDQVVPCRDSRLFQRTVLHVDASATVIAGETVLPGRVAYDERHVYDLFLSETEVRRPDGTLLFADLLRLRPKQDDVTSLGVLGGHDIVGSMYVLTTAVTPSDLVDALRAHIALRSDVTVTVTELPGECGAGVRILGSGSIAVQHATRAVWAAARHVLFGTPVPDLRKG